MGAEMIPLPALTFWYVESASLGMESLLRKIVTEMKSKGHPANVEIAGIVVAAFVIAQRQPGSSVSQFNEVFGEIASAELTQHYLISTAEFPKQSGNFSPGRIGSFMTGPFDPERLAYQCRRAGSDFFDRYEATLRAIPFSFEREHRTVKVIQWQRLLFSEGRWATASDLFALRSRIIDRYFAALSALYFEDFFTEFAAVQELPMALGSAWIEMNRLEEFLGSHLVSIYRKIGGQNAGFVSPTARLRLEVNLGGAHLGVPATETFLKKHFSYAGDSTSEVYQSIKTFTHFLALAERHAAANRKSEAFVHFVIALDLLLGDPNASTSGISTRGAALVHEALDKDYPSMWKELQRIYNARSKYVHEGRIPEAPFLDSVRTISREVAFCLLRLQKAPENRSAGFHERWIKDLDVVVAKKAAGHAIPENELSGVGIATPGDVRHSDFLAMLKSPPPIL